MVVGDSVYTNAGTWTLADPNDEAKLALGMVSIVDGDDITITFSGLAKVTGHGFGVGLTYYIDPAAVGKPTVTKPTTSGDYIQVAFTPVDTDNLLVGDKIAVAI